MVSQARSSGLPSRVMDCTYCGGPSGVGYRKSRVRIVPTGVTYS